MTRRLRSGSKSSNMSVMCLRCCAISVCSLCNVNCSVGRLRAAPAVAVRVSMVLSLVASYSAMVSLLSSVRLYVVFWSLSTSLRNRLYVHSADVSGQVRVCQ